MNASGRSGRLRDLFPARAAVGAIGLVTIVATLACTHSQPAKKLSEDPNFLGRTDEIFSAYKSKDVKKLLDHYTPDALCLFFDQPLRFDVGRAAIEARMKRFFDSVESGEITPAADIRIHVTRDRAWTTRFAKAKFTLKNGTKYDFDGWHSAIWVKVSGVWLIEYEHVGGRMKTTVPPPPVIAPPPPPVVVIELRDVFFDFDLWNIRPDQVETLEYNAKILKENPDVKVLIEGHCDERGTLDYNVGLGKRRADSTKAAMVALGIDAARMGTASVGKDPVFEPGHGEPIWGRNRRSHFVVVKP
jgi:peptidoglycan-associated lipoprotein